MENEKDISVLIGKIHECHDELFKLGLKLESETLGAVGMILEILASGKATDKDMDMCSKHLLWSGLSPALSEIKDHPLIQYKDKPKGKKPNLKNAGIFLIDVSTEDINMREITACLSLASYKLFEKKDRKNATVMSILNMCCLAIHGNKFSTEQRFVEKSKTLMASILMTATQIGIPQDMTRLIEDGDRFDDELENLLNSD